MRSDKENIIVDLSFKFALRIVEFVELLNENRKFVIANQLLKSGTSIGANIRESQNAESKQDFIHKMKIASKEADESVYWSDICKESPKYPYDKTLSEDLTIIIKILNKIIGTSKRSSKI